MPDRTRHLLEAIQGIQRQLLEARDLRRVADSLLLHLIEATESEYGFIGEVLADPNGAPFLKTLAISNIAWDETTRRFYAEHAPAGLEFRNLRTLFGAVLSSGELVVANDAPHDARAGGVPSGHPPLRAFLGVPLKHAGQMIGVVGVANRAGGYGPALVAELEPSFAASASLVVALRVERERSAAAQILHARALQHEAVAALGLHAIAARDPIELVAEAAAIARRTLGIEIVEVLSLDGTTLVPLVAHGFEGFSTEAPRYPLDSRSPAAIACASRAPVKFSRLADDTRFVGLDALIRAQAESGVCVPIIGRSETRGAFCVHSRRRRSFSDDDVAFLQSLANVLAQSWEAQTSAAALADARMRLERAEHLSLVMPTHVSLDGRFLRVPPRLCELLGYSESELLGRTFDEFTHPDDVAAGDAALTRLVSGTVPFIDLEKRYRTKDGRDVWVELTSCVVRDAIGRPLHLLTYMRDVTGRKNAEAERHRLEDQLRQTAKMESIGMLAGGVSHDFNNLLQVILGNLEIASSKLDSAEDPRPELEQIGVAGNRAALLVKQLLAFSRRQAIEPERVDLRAIAVETAGLLRRVIPENTTLELIPGDEPCLAMVDPAQIEQVLINLCVNARDAMPDGGKITIELHPKEFAPSDPARPGWVAPGRYVEMCVADTGAGMTREQQAHLFEPFFTTKPPGSGTGLGLAMVYGTVRQHGGAIDVDSAPGRGTRVCVYFPVASGGSTAEAEAEPATAGGGDEWLLVAEDDDQVRELIASVLSGAGYHVVVAKDGEEAIRAFERHRGKIRLALLDAVMPKKDGREVRDHIASRSRGLPVLLISGYGEASAPGDAVLEKPFARGPLLRRVRELLDRPR